MEDFNNGVVLTSRVLRPNETFQVRIDSIIDKWAGSIGKTSDSNLRAFSSSLHYIWSAVSNVFTMSGFESAANMPPFTTSLFRDLQFVLFIP